MKAEILSYFTGLYVLLEFVLILEIFSIFNHHKKIDNDADRLTTIHDEEDDNMTGTPLYEDHNEFLHGQKSRSNKDKIISSKFIRKYLYVAKMQKPILTKVHLIASSWFES